MENFDLVKSPETTLKLCGKCNKEKTIIPNFSIHFRKDRGRKTISSNCKECITKNSKQWYSNNKNTEKYKDTARRLKTQYKITGKDNGWAKDRYHKYKKIVFDYYGNKCACCNEAHLEFLTIEHKLHDGQQHRKTKRAGVYKDIIDQGFPDKYTIFCSNCNFATRYKKECPHQAEKNSNNILIFETRN